MFFMGFPTQFRYSSSELHIVAQLIQAVDVMGFNDYLFCHTHHM